MYLRTAALFVLFAFGGSSSSSISTTSSESESVCRGDSQTKYVRDKIGTKPHQDSCFFSSTFWGSLFRRSSSFLFRGSFLLRSRTIRIQLFKVGGHSIDIHRHRVFRSYLGVVIFCFTFAFALKKLKQGSNRGQ